MFHGFPPKKVGIKKNPSQTKPSFICCLPSLSSPPCHSLPGLVPFPSLLLAYDLCTHPFKLSFPSFVLSSHPFFFVVLPHAPLKFPLSDPRLSS